MTEEKKTSGLSAMEALLEKDLEKAKTRSQLHLFAVVALVVVVFTYLHWVNRSVGKALDEELLAGLVRSHVEQSLLPKAGPELDKFLVEKTPALVSAMIDSGLSSLPLLRIHFEEKLVEPLRPGISDLRVEMTEAMAEALTTRQEEITTLIDGLQSEEGKTQLAKLFAEVFEKEYEAHAKAMAQQTHQRFQAFDTYLRTVLLTPEADLSPAMRAERELVLRALSSAEVMLMQEYTAQLVGQFFTMMQK